MQFAIEPNVGATPLQFGSVRANVRALLAGFSRSQHAAEPENDFYSSDGLILGYDKDDLLEFIEIFPPSSAEFAGVSVFQVELAAFVTKLIEAGGKPAPLSGGQRFPELGVANFCPQKKLESVSVYRREYYD